MNTRLSLALSLVLSSVCISADAQIELLRDVSVPGTTIDASGLTGELADGTPANRLGGPSGLSWTGRGQVYLWLSDSGPKDGATTHTPRYHEADLALSFSNGDAPVIRRTITLKQENGEPLTGHSVAINDKEPKNSPRFDSEGIALWEGKTVVSEEYGPSIAVFGKDGKMQSHWPVPDRFFVAKPSGIETDEIKNNNAGRQPNAGFEGLCSDGNGGLLAILQRPLLQDGGLNANGKRFGRNVRLLQMCGPNCKPREFVYVLDDPSAGVSEICHAGGSQFLSIECDSKHGAEAKTKKIMLFDIADATDISRTEHLPFQELPKEIKPVHKKLFLDLLDPRFQLNKQNFPEKIEGLTFGPTLEDGRRLLVVATDNDFEADEPIRFWFFVVPKELLK